MRNSNFLQTSLLTAFLVLILFNLGQISVGSSLFGGLPDRTSPVKSRLDKKVVIVLKTSPEVRISETAQVAEKAILKKDYKRFNRAMANFANISQEPHGIDVLRRTMVRDTIVLMAMDAIQNHGDMDFLLGIFDSILDFVSTVELEAAFMRVMII